MHNKVIQAINSKSDFICSVGEHIWKNPESGFKEVKTSAYLVKILEDMGLKVETGLAVTGFRADIDTGKPGPTVAVLQCHPLSQQRRCGGRRWHRSCLSSHRALPTGALPPRGGLRYQRGAH